MRISPVAALTIGTALALCASPAAAPTPGLQTVRANDNRAAAGRLAGSVLHVSLEAREAIWHPDGDQQPGVRIQALAQAGGPPQIPGPLLRVRAGTQIVASIRNTIPGTVLDVHGLVD